jgi:phosphoserine/homoserine phosphotransferase
MRARLKILDQHGLKLQDIQRVIGNLRPLDGALAFLDWLRERSGVIILSDTFNQFAQPLLRQLAWPVLFCNTLEVGPDGRILDYHLRLPDQKRASVQALKGLNFRIVAAGDSYNDTGMMLAADAGIFFRPPDKIAIEFPQFPVTRDYDQLRQAFERAGLPAQ